MLRAAAAALAVIAGFLGLMYVRFSGDTVPAPDATPSPVAATPPPIPTPAVGALPWILNGVDVASLNIAPEVELPDGFALIVETGCTQCDGPTTGLARVYRDVTGSIHSEVLFTPEKVGISARVIRTANGAETVAPEIRGFDATPDASEMIVGVCTAGACGGLGFSGDPEATVTVFRSSDGGVTWAEFGALEGDAVIVGRLAPGSVLISTYDDVRGSRYERFPEGDVITPPAGAVWPSVLSTGEVIWHTQGSGLLWSDGSVYIDPGEPPGLATSLYGEVYVGDPLPGNGGRALSSLTVAHHDRGPDNYLIDTLGGAVKQAYTKSSGLIVPNVWFDESTVFANVSFEQSELVSPPSDPFMGWLPAVIDLRAGLITPIAGPFLQPPLLNGRNTIVAVQRGPFFARVVNTEGTCLYIRTEPRTDAPSLDCVAEGVLLRDLAGIGEAGVVTWRHVVTPSGTTGWASADYLEL